MSSLTWKLGGKEMAIEGISGMMPLSGMCKPNATQMSNNIIKALDTDGDGALSTSEISALQDKLKAADTNGDGLVTSAELIAQISAKLEENGGPSLMQDSAKPDISKIKQVLAELNNSQTGTTSGDQSIADLLGQLLKDLGVSKEDTKSLFDLLKKDGVDLSA